MCRPEKIIDWDLVDKLLIAGCLGTEIASHFDMHPKTFYDRVYDKYKVTFTEYSQERRSHGDSLLRKAQFDKALEKDNTMMIWLGKQRLNQKENHEISIDNATLSEFSASMGWFRKMQDARKTEEGDVHEVRKIQDS